MCVNVFNPDRLGGVAGHESEMLRRPLPADVYGDHVTVLPCKTLNQSSELQINVMWLLISNC